tara:strand:+ start:25491 stop:26300 length:810 start_codon:yes stop_codon:yes gene_type:complete
MKNASLVSIVIPVYNAESYIESTVNSVLTQTHTYWELIIVDNGSTDNSSSIIKKLAESNHRIKVISLEKNSGGPAYPRNKGIKEANGYYIAFLDADDIWHKNKLEYQIEFLERKNLDFVFCDAEFINSSGERSYVLKKSKINKFLSKIFGPSFALLISNPVSLSSCLMKSNLDNFFNTKNNFQSIEDWLFWIELALSGKKFGLLNQRLIFYRKHGDSVSIQNGLRQYLKIFALYRLLLSEGQIGILIFLFLSFLNSIRIIKYFIFGRHL